LDGRTYGELLVGTAQVLRDGRPIAALIISRFAGDPPYGGPWITDVFRDPEDPLARGLGGVLIRRALALLAGTGEPALTLAVTAGNPAAQRYEALGFTRCWEARRLRLPPR
jgi:GNAT superfamily N-acetyltransferase